MNWTPLSIRCLVIPVVLAVQLLAATAPAAAEETVEELEQQAMKAALAKIAPSVVRIETIGGLERVGQTLVGTGPTTGVVVSEDGYVVSSAFNFIQMPTSILVTLPDGQRTTAQIVARDQSRMIVLLKVNAESKLTVPAGVPREEMRVGQWTLAIGRAFDKDQPNLSVGVLSARERIWGKALQTDAKISPSNYGGPLIDIEGRVLGVLVPLSPRGTDAVAGTEWYDSGIGFAIPFTDILARLDQLKTGEDLHAGLLGITLKGNDIYASQAEVSAVRPNSPAYEGGLQPGDVIIKAEGRPVVRQAQLKHVLGQRYAGDEISLVVKRGEEELELKVALAKELIPYQHPFLGILPRRYEAEPQAGVPVAQVMPESPAAQAGLQANDRILAVGDAPTADADALRTAIANLEPQEKVRVNYQRGGETKDVELTLGTLPVEIPAALPEREALPPVPEDLPPVGRVEVKIIEETNECFAYVPENYNPARPFGLLVWLHAPGKLDEAKIIDQWKETCAAREFILLVPKSDDPAKWTPTEVDFVRKTIDDVLNKYQIDRNRVVVGGDAAGGSMAYLVAFKHQELVRGIVAVDAAIPGRTAIPDNDPVNRLAILAVLPEKSKLTRQIEAGNKRLSEANFPVTVVAQEGEPRALDNEQREQLARWLDALDRI